MNKVVDPVNNYRTEERKVVMTGFKLHLIDLALILGAICAILLGGFTAFADNCEQVPKEILRLHILANSDSEADQQLKYELRDYMLTTFKDIFYDCDNLEESVAAAEKNKVLMQTMAQSFIYSKGYTYNVTCEIAKTYFTTRNYGAYIAPAGEYQAVRFIIGEGEGKNWWCVMFPPLCIPAAGEFFTEEQSKNIESDKNIEVRFALFEMIDSLFDGNTGEEEPSKEQSNCVSNVVAMGIDFFESFQ